MSIKCTWTAPTTRVKGGALSDADIASYDLQMRVQGAPSFTSVNNSKVTEFVIDVADPGTYEFECFTVLTDGSRSAPATGAIMIADTSAPNPPQSFTVVLQ